MVAPIPRELCLLVTTLIIGVPFGRPVNPINKGDWEGTGVEPDVKVDAADALLTAEKLATDKLATKDNHP